MRSGNSDSRLLANDLVTHIQSGADRRIEQQVRGADIGLVLTASPLVVRPLYSGTDPSFRITAQDIVCDPDATFSKNQMVVCTPLKAGYWFVAPADGSGTSTGANAGGGDVPGSGSVNAALDSSLRDKAASDRIIAQATKYVGVTPEGGANHHSLMDQVGGSAIYTSPWCGYFVQAIYKTALVNDDGVCRAAVSSSYNAARVLALTVISNPGDYPGCIVIKLIKPLASDGSAQFTGGSPSDHTSLFIEGNATRATTIGGNEGGNVQKNVNVTLNPGGKYAHIAFLAPSGLKESKTSTEPPAASPAPGVGTDPDEFP